MRTTFSLLIAGLALAALVACTSTAPAVTSVTIDGGDRTIVLGDPLTLTATVGTTGGASTSVTWTSDDETVATIGANGTVDSLTPGTTEITATSTADPTRADSITLTVDPQGALRWTRQFGTGGGDDAYAIASEPGGGVFIAGHTFGALEGANAGSLDAFIRAYDAEGNLRWTRQFGTGSADVAYAIATDASGNVYVAGATEGALEGPNAGGDDAFIRAYDPDGDLRWTRQFGTSGSEAANGIATDAQGNVYAAGYTSGALEGPTAGGADAFIRAYDAEGNLRWTRQFGTSGFDQARGIATDAQGNVYAAGSTEGGLEGLGAGGIDAFIRAYDPDGDLRWTRQFGTSENDVSNGIATDADGNVTTVGFTEGALEGLGAGGADAFIRAYDADGDLRWTRQFGTSGLDVARAIATDAHGIVYSTGLANGVLEGAYAGGDDAFIRAYDPGGDLRWTRQFGTSSDDVARGIATDADGNVVATGTTEGALVGSSAGGPDAFVRSYGR